MRRRPWVAGHVELVVLAALVACAPAGACVAQEVRLGLAYSAPTLVYGKSDGPEQGASLLAEYDFKPIRALHVIGSPRPFVSAVISLDGYTDFAQGGLQWRFSRGKAYLDLGAGLAIHDGHLSLPEPQPGLTEEENARRRRLRQDHSEQVYRTLLHANFAVGWRLSERLALEVTGQHWSNGHLGTTYNDGADVLGLRLAYRH